MNKIIDFKNKYEKFLEALAYVNKNITELKADPKRWNKVMNNFHQRFQKPLDEAWEALSEQQKKPFLSLYVHRRDISDELWQRIMKVKKVFDGTIKTKIIEEIE